MNTVYTQPFSFRAEKKNVDEKEKANASYNRKEAYLYFLKRL